MSLQQRELISHGAGAEAPIREINYRLEIFIST